MKKWKCTVCGYEFSGDAQPEKCPACSAGQERIEEAEQESHKDDGQESNTSTEVEKQEEKSDASERKWKCTICNYIHVGPEPPDECPICGADKSYFVEVTDDETADEEKEAAPEKSELKEEHPAEPPKETKQKNTFGFLGRLILGLNLHPITVHTPNGVLPLAVIFLVLAMYFQYWTLEWAAFFNYIAVFLSMPVVFATGYIAWQRKYNGART